MFYGETPLNLSSQKPGAMVRYVDASMPASTLGLRHGDVVIAVNSELTPEWLKAATRVHELLRSRECIYLRINRAGQEKALRCIRGEIRDGTYFKQLQETAEENAPILNVDGKVEHPGEYSTAAGGTIADALAAAGISGDASVVCFTLLERSTTDTGTCQPYRGRAIPGLQPNRSYILTFK